jgi:hypothetical protein
MTSTSRPTRGSSVVPTSPPVAEVTETSALRWFEPVPARRVELVRSLVFGYAAAWLLLRGPYLADVADLPARRFEPIGVLGALSSPPPGWVVLVTWVVTLVAAVSVTAAWRVRLAAPIGAAGMLALATYASSFGQVFHTEHLLVLHMAVLAVAAVVEPPADRDGTTSAWPLNLMMAIVAVAYVVAGAAKLRHSGVDWIAGDVLRRAVAMDNLRKLLLEDWYSPLGGWLSAVAWIWGPIAFVTIVVELGAPLALVPGRARQAWIALAWGFHVGIFVLMAISFPYQLFGVAYAAFLPLERALEQVRSRLAGWRPRSQRPVGRTL